MDPASLHRGTAPLLISLPHDGSAIPDELAARMTADARRAPDTEWHLSRLDAFAREVQFTGAPVYLAGQAPSGDEVAARVERYWRPYHDALGGELERLRARHG